MEIEHLIAYNVALLISTLSPGPSMIYLAVKPTLDRIAALALGAIGGRLLLDR